MASYLQVPLFSPSLEREEILPWYPFWGEEVVYVAGIAQVSEEEPGVLKFSQVWAEEHFAKIPHSVAEEVKAL